jgi:hypothetical protein
VIFPFKVQLAVAEMGADEKAKLKGRMGNKWATLMRLPQVRACPTHALTHGASFSGAGCLKRERERKRAKERERKRECILAKLLVGLFFFVVGTHFKMLFRCMF